MLFDLMFCVLSSWDIWLCAFLVSRDSPDVQKEHTVFSAASLNDLLTCLLLVLQVEGADSLTVGLLNEREAEPPEPLLQPRLLWSTSCAGALHPAQPLQVSAGYLFIQRFTWFVCFCLIDMFTSLRASQVLEEHVPPVWSVHASTAVRPQNPCDSEGEQP